MSRPRISEVRKGGLPPLILLKACVVAILMTCASPQSVPAAQRKNRAPVLRFNNINLKTGVRLHYATQGKPSGHPIIMLHGYTDSWYSYSRVLPLLSTEYRIYVLDQRGHGNSTRPAKGYEIPSLARDVLAFMDAKQIKEATIVGHSMGSFVAQHVAATAPHRITRLVLVGSGATLDNDAVSEFHKAVSGLRDPVPVKFVRDFQESSVFAPVPRQFMDRVIAESLKLPARVWQELINGFLRSDVNAELNKITAPVLVIWGEKDSFFPRSTQDVLVSALSQAVFRPYAETGHSPHWERPEQFVKDLEEFMRKS